MSDGMSEQAMLLLGAVGNDRVTKTGGYRWGGKKVHARILGLRQKGLVEDGRYVYHRDNDFPDYSIVELTEAGKQLVEVAHPFPWRGICRHCGEVLTRDEWGQPWVIKSLHGASEECQQAPLMDGDPGRHSPRRALSSNGAVEDAP
jgi:hypothetical protein